MKLFKKLRKGFTLIELVVVIAVIAILSAVSVVSYVAITNKAHQSNDQQLVDQVNTSLYSYGIQKKPSTMHEALLAVEEDGFIPANMKISPEYKGYKFAYNLEDNQFVILDSKMKVSYPKDANKDAAAHQLWLFADSASDISSTKLYSHYLRPGFEGSEIAVESGVDVGENTGIAKITYTTSDEQEVVIRTDSPYTTLNVIAGSSTVNHYGNANAVNITSVDKHNSYHEFGSVAAINVKEGKIDVEKDAYVGKVAIDEDATSSTVKVNVNGGTIFGVEVIGYDETEYNHTASAESNPVATQIESKVTETDSVLKVGSASALINLANAQSQGMVEGTLSIEITSDIDLTGKTWIPFGQNSEHAFEGTIDGKSHTITGLSNKGYTGQIYTNTVGFTGDNYGFIADSKGEVTVKNLTFKDVSLNGANIACGVVIGRTSHVELGYYSSSVTLSNVHVKSGTIESNDKAAGLIGYVTGKDNVSNFTNVYVDNCSVKATIRAIEMNGKYGYRAGGFFGYVGDFSKVKISGNSSFDGEISVAETSKKWTGAIFGAFGNNTSSINVVSFTCSGTIEQANGVGGKRIQNESGLSLGFVQDNPATFENVTNETAAYVAGSSFSIKRSGSTLLA